MIRPSSLPALAECPCFESGSSDFAEGGTDRHDALKAHFSGDDTLLDLLGEEDADGVRWAAEYIRLHAPLSDYPAQYEKTLNLLLDDFSEISGTPDVTCHLDLFDLKWRQRDYTAQMAAYALMRLQELGIDAMIRVHLLYAAFKRVEVLKIDAEAARKIVEPIIARARDPQRQPNPCDYCGMCAARLTCSALNDRAQTIATGREDWKLEQYHTSAIEQPGEMAKALALARQVKKWAEAVEFHAKEMVIKKGLQLPGYSLKEKQGKRSVTDLNAAFSLTALPLEQFVACCEVRWSKSKKDPVRLGLEDVYAKQHGLSKAAAKKELKNKLQNVTRITGSSQMLKADKPTTDEEEGETIDA